MKIYPIWLPLVAFISMISMTQAQTWVNLNIWNECPMVKVEYQKMVVQKQTVYQLRKQDAITREYIYFPGNFSSINDPKEILEFIKDDLGMYCSNINTALLFECEDLPESPIFTEEFNKFIGGFEKIITPISSNLSCQEWRDLTKLQSDVESLKTEKDFKDKSKRIGFKILVGLLRGKSEKMVEQFAQCGGKSNSDIFVRNLILLEAKNMCLYPKPPGSLSFKEAIELASEVAKPYKGMGLLKLNSKVDEITYSASFKIVENVASASISEILGLKNMSSVIPKIRELENYKNLKKKLNPANSKVFQYEGKNYKTYDHNMDYLNTIAVNDLPFEIVESFLPDLVSSFMGSSLPVSMSQSEKDSYLKNNLLPNIRENYLKCITPLKKELKVRTKSEQFKTTLVEDQALVEEKKSIKTKYCQKYPRKCNAENACENKVSYRSDADDKRNEMTRIQACILQSFHSAVPLVVEKTIASLFAENETIKQMPIERRENLEKKLNVDVPSFLNECINNKVASKTGAKFKGTDYNTFSNELLNTNDFAKFTTECSGKVEGFAIKLVSSDFLRYTDALFKPNDNKEEVITELIDLSLNNCITEQNSLAALQKEYPRNLSSCTAFLELNAARNIISDKLEELSVGLNKEKVTPIISEFNKCIDQDHLEMKKILTINPRELDHFIDSPKSRMYSCIQNSIKKMGALVANSQYKDLIQKNKETIQNKAFALKLVPQVEAEIQDCLSDQLFEKNKNWSEFKKEATAELFAATTYNCQNRIENLVLPKILVAEATSSMGEIVKTGLLTQGGNEYQVGNILALTAARLRNQYGVNLPSNINSNAIIEYSLREALKNYKEKNPQKGFDYFIKEFQTIAEEEGSKVVHSNISKEMDRMDKEIGMKHKLFVDTLNAKCLKDIGNVFSKIDWGDGTSAESTRTVIARMIHEGLEYTLKVGDQAYKDQVQKVKNFCSSLKPTDSVKKVASSGVADFIVKAQIQKKVVEALMKNIENDYIKKLEEIKSPADLEVMRRAFLVYKKDTLTKLVQKLNEGKYIEEILFKDGSLMKYAQNNFEKILIEGTPEAALLEKSITTKLFSERGEGSFADQFGKAQILEGVGLEGAIRTQTKINGNYWIDSWAGNLVNLRKKANRNFNANWTPQVVEEQFAWTEFDSNKRKEIISKLVDEVIIPQSLVGESKSAQEKVDKSLAGFSKYVDEYLNVYRYKNKKLFEEKMNDLISPI